MRELEGGEVSDILGHPSMNQSIEEYLPPPESGEAGRKAGEAGILQYEQMEDRGAEVGSRIPGSPAVSPSSVPGEQEKEPATSDMAGGDDSMEEEAIQMAMDVGVEPTVEPRCPTSPAVSPSSSAGEDNKALVLEPYEAATTGDAGDNDAMEEDGRWREEARSIGIGSVIKHQGSVVFEREAIRPFGKKPSSLFPYLFIL